MNSEKIKEALCVIAFVLFVVFLTAETKTSDKSAEEVFKSVGAAMQLDEHSEIKKCGGQKLKKQFGFSENDFNGSVYYASDSVMEVREILLVKLKEGISADAVTEALEKRVTDKAALFKGYAPEQSAMLDRYVIVKKGGFVLFVVWDSPEKIVSAFKKSL